ncbi:MAG: hypothetical protein ACK4IK_05785 [Bacteroidia bacterium]
MKKISLIVLLCLIITACKKEKVQMNEENQGFDVGATQIKLLEKDEEMMLYIIELKKENEALKQDIISLKNKYYS